MFARTLILAAVVAAVMLFSSCIRPSDKVSTPKLLATDNASQPQLVAEINRFARVTSLRAKIGIKFEDNSFAENGIAEKYKTADGEIVVQRPGNIFLKIQLPVVKSDVAQMASNGQKFCIAILTDGGDGKFKKFVCGTNDADYSPLEKKVTSPDIANTKTIKQNVNAFKDIRPQHLTDALLVRPTEPQSYVYTMSTIMQEEVDMELMKQKSPLAWILHGYYLIDEFTKNADGSLIIARRFWFDRVGGIRIARQQIFDAKGEIESDITYGKEGNVGATTDFGALPLQISVMRPKEKYKMTLSYSSPENVSLGKTYKPEAFILKNDFGLQEVNLDAELEKLRSAQTTSPTPSSATKFQ